MLRDSHIPVHPDDQRRLDIVATGLPIAQGLPLFCDVTVLSPLTRNGDARPGTSNQGGSLLAAAERENNDMYEEIRSSGFGTLLCLGAETYGRWGAQAVWLVPALATERTRHLHPRIRTGIALASLHRWWGILGIALQNVVAHAIQHAHADLGQTLLEPPPRLADLDIV